MRWIYEPHVHLLLGSFTETSPQVHRTNIGWALIGEAEPEYYQERQVTSG